MDVRTPAGEVTVNRKRGSESYELAVTFNHDKGDSEHVYTVSLRLGPLVDTHISSRSDITASVVREAVDSMFDRIDDMDNVGTITNVNSIEIISDQALWKTPYSERYDDE